MTFWNKVFLEIGSPFRLGQVTHLDEAIPYHYVRPYPERGSDELDWLFNWDTGELDLPWRIRKSGGDIVVVLTGGFRSFATRTLSPQRALIVIGSHNNYRADHATLVQNVIAHELGHAIGLGHNDDMMSLMCGGRAWWCALTRAPKGFLPLTRAEKLKLLEMYPASWREGPPSRWKGDPPAALSAG